MPAIQPDILAPAWGSEQYGKGTPSYTISEIFSPIPREYNQGPFKLGVIQTSPSFTSEVMRANGSSDRYSKFHVGGIFIAGKDEGADWFGKRKLGGTYGCFGIVDASQISKYNFYKIDPSLVVPSNSETQRFGTAVEAAKKMQIDEHGKKADVQVELQKRTYEKVKVTDPGKGP